MKIPTKHLLRKVSRQRILLQHEGSMSWIEESADKSSQMLFPNIQYPVRQGSTCITLVARQTQNRVTRNREFAPVDAGISRESPDIVRKQPGERKRKKEKERASGGIEILVRFTEISKLRNFLFQPICIRNNPRMMIANYHQARNNPRAATFTYHRPRNNTLTAMFSFRQMRNTLRERLASGGTKGENKKLMKCT